MPFSLGCKLSYKSNHDNAKSYQILLDGPQTTNILSVLNFETNRINVFVIHCDVDILMVII